jgi:uncharacterized protein
MPLDSLKIPAFTILVNQKPLKDSIIWQIFRITIDDQIDLPSMFTLELEASEETMAQTNWINDKKLFAIGDEVNIKLGYENKVQDVISGEVTFVEIEFRSASLPRLMVRGFDRRHRLQRGRKTRTFLKKKDSDIAKQIANEAGISIQATDSAVIHDYMVQANQTDFAFLQERARRINYEIVMDGKSLQFRPVAFDAAPAIQLSLDKELSKFTAQLSVTNQITQAKVSGWDIKNKKTFSANANQSSNMGGLIGSNLVNKAFGKAEKIISDEPVADLQEAKERAATEFSACSLSLIRGEGKCPGLNTIKAGKVVEIKGIGSRFSGKYYITAVTHSYGMNGYQTNFTAWRNAT